MQNELKSRTRDDYRYFFTCQTRWSDNDQYSHVNNSIYYHYFDSCINKYLIEKCNMIPSDSQSIGLVVSSYCEFFSPLSFPVTVTLGLRVNKLGKSSVTYEIGVFEQSKHSEPAAVGGYTHVFVNRDSRRSTTMPTETRNGLNAIAVGQLSKL